MTKIKLVNGTIINADSVELVNGVLNILTTEKTVEELHEIFADKSNTSVIVLMTESEIEIGYKIGFTSLAGIRYVDRVKTVELIQPVDMTEARIANAEGMAVKAYTEASELEEAVNALLGVGVNANE